METDQIRQALRTRYASVASQPEGQFSYAVGRSSAQDLDYPDELLDVISTSVVDRFVGVGNPFSLGRPRVGSCVVDVGCGAGFDSQIAAHLVGPTGKVDAIDLCPEMLAIANSGYEDSPLDNITFREGLAEALSVDDGWADLVISNGVLNLTTCKASAFAEIARVLRPGGRLQAVDLILVERLPDDLRNDEFAWSN